MRSGGRRHLGLVARILVVLVAVVILAAVGVPAGMADTAGPQVTDSRIALAGPPGMSGSFLKLSKTASVVGPLGINPLLAIGALGIAIQAGVWEPPQSLSFIGHPVVWILALVLGLTIKLGRSTKITKPVAEAIGTGESLLAVAVVALAAVPMFQNVAATHAESGVAAGVLFIIAGTLTLGLVIAVRTALDILIWLSPFPFVDFLFQLVKAMVTVALVVLAVFAPWVAIVVNLILIIIAALVFRWAMRTTRFGLTMARDLTIGRFRAKLELPRDEVVATDLGPFDVFVLAVAGLPRRQQGSLLLQAERWDLTTKGLFGREKTINLGDAEKSELAKGFLGIEVETPGGVVLMPPRYKHLLEEIRLTSQAKVVETPAKSKRHLLVTELA